MAALPKTIHVGPLDVAVKADRTRSEDAKANGFCDVDELLIVIDPKQPPSLARQTLLHEVLHIASFMAGIQKEPALVVDDAAEERLVHTLTPWLLSALRSNPDLIAYLTA